jgi:allantoin racemase
VIRVCWPCARAAQCRSAAWPKPPTKAARYGRFAVVTGGARWAPTLQRLAHTLGFADALAGVHTVAPTGAQLAADPVAARALLAQACREARQR